jgi:hypothetical protein
VELHKEGEPWCTLYGEVPAKFQDGEEMAAVCLMMQFATMDRAKYDDVMKALDWQNTGSPKGLISHMAGPMQQGWGVVDVWESQADFDRFLEMGLRRAFEQAGARMPQMQMTVFEVHNRYP